MNGRRAKALRRMVYGQEGAKRNPYKYTGMTREEIRAGKKVNILIGGLLCAGKRAEYQRLKREGRSKL